jgi:excisionase family DNA binding protein
MQHAAPSFTDSLDRLTWLTTKEAAHYLRTSQGGIRNMVWRGQLYCYKPHGRLLFKKSDLDRVVERSRRGDFQ